MYVRIGRLHFKIGKDGVSVSSSDYFIIADTKIDVIHTVGPIARGHINGSHKEDLANCYKSSLKLVKENNIRSVAFPCISTGIYGFPNEPAAVIALSTAKEWLAKNHHEVGKTTQS
ncbi:hypothetical protein HJG60_012546 [Phyllostomus discolor]|uniref:Macro domain-containing protein n=1 Tax=Phyllostomus discolor TaxID=89673 RepID=A0A833ZBA4_9CHIR|nr:hypothetical protein HJG60_012546 [Phyllostomus discolor]